MNILFCSAGRRVELLNNFRKSLSSNSRIVATDMSAYAPALYVADAYYLVPSIYDENYLPRILDICKREKIQAILTLIDPEIEILAKHRREFETLGILVLTPDADTAAICFDKYKFFQHLRDNGIMTPNTYQNLSDAKAAIDAGELKFPVFVKPRTGSGSVGARQIKSIELLERACKEDPSLIIQELMQGGDMDADVYIDTISHKTVSIFSKKKIETKIGGASKTISFKDDKLFAFLEHALSVFNFNGPIDADLFFQNGEYYLSEINPRFGGAYLHAYGAGLDFIKMIENNANGNVNVPCYGNYEENVVMMMYDSVIIEKINR